MATRPTLRPLALRPLPLGEIRPAGWLARQLRLQADGLSGHLDEFWPDIAQSAWFGGPAEGWERVPYWLDGLVPLAVLLDDPTLLRKVRRAIDEILVRQQADGWFGPLDKAGSRSGHEVDPWPRFPLLKALAQWHEATDDVRIIPAMLRFCRRLAVLLADAPLRSWAHHRWADLVVVLHWLHDRTGEDWLLALAGTAQRQGYDWKSHFAKLRYTGRCSPEECTRDSHVVNNAMGLKQPGVWFRQSNEAADAEAVLASMATLDHYHGQVTGAFTGDEHLAGRNPSQGTELCAIVEYLYSLEVCLATLGDRRLADRLEQLTYNCLPATFSPDLWAHQYDQQANQVVCRVSDDKVYTSNRGDANIFGLEPNFGCCTANMHQGWPKFAAHLWYATPDGGLAAMAYAPCDITTRIREVPVRLRVTTDYPFRESVEIAVITDQPVDFALHVRAPAWCHGATLTDNAGTVLDIAAGSSHPHHRRWTGTQRLTLHLPMAPRVIRGYQASVAIARGPLVYALRIGEAWRQIAGELPHADWEVEPTTPWNYALSIDPAEPATTVRFREQPVGDRPFSLEGAPMLATVPARRLPEWQLAHNAAMPPPPSPVTSLEPLEEVTLVPYGCTNLRISEFPLSRA